MKVLGVIVIWTCIVVVIKEKQLLANATWTLHTPPRLQTKKLEGQNESVAVLIPMNQNTTGDRSNEVEWQSITHPEHKTKRCKSLTPLRKVRLSAPLKKVNNDETASQSGHAMNKIEVTLPSLKMKNSPPKSLSLSLPTHEDNSIPIPRVTKSVGESDENETENLRPARDSEEVSLRSKKYSFRQKKNKYLCYCFDEECTKKAPLESLDFSKNSPVPKRLQNTNLYSQTDAVMGSPQEVSLGGRGRPLIYKKQSSKRPSNKRLGNKNCTPVIVECEANDKPTRINLPLGTDGYQGSLRRPGMRVPPAQNNYQTFTSADRLSNIPYGSPYDAYEMATPPLENMRGIPEQPHLGSAYGGLNDCSNPAMFSSLEECNKFCGRDVCYPVMNSFLSANTGYPLGYAHDNYQSPVIGSAYDEYSNTGYDHYLENPAYTGVVDSSTDYLMHFPNDVEEESHVGSSNQDYPTRDEDEAVFRSSSRQYSAGGQGKNGVEFVVNREKDQPGLGGTHNVIVQPGLTNQYSGAPADIPKNDFPQVGRFPNVIQPGFSHQYSEYPADVPKNNIPQVGGYGNFVHQTGFTHQYRGEPANIPKTDIPQVGRIPNVIPIGFTHQYRGEPAGIPEHDFPQVGRVPHVIQSGITHQYSGEPADIPRSSLPQVGKIDPIVQPGFTQANHGEGSGFAGNAIIEDSRESEDFRENSSERSQQEFITLAEVPGNYFESTPAIPQAPVLETNGEGIENPLDVAYQENQDVDEEDISYSEESTEGQVSRHYPTPGTVNRQYQFTTPPETWRNFNDYGLASGTKGSSESSIFGRPYEASDSFVDHSNSQGAEVKEEPPSVEEDSSEASVVVAPKISQQLKFSDCPLAEPASPSADQHLRDLEALTGLSIEDSKLLRGTIYEALNLVASNIREQTESNKVPSSCEIIGAPEPEKIPGLGDIALLRNLLHTPEVRNLVLGTIKGLIPQVTGTSRDSSLGKLTDTIINSSLNVILGEEDLPEDSGDPSLGLVNENVGSVPDQIGTIITSLINQPGVGLQNALLPGVQNIIVRTLGEIMRRGKNVVDNSIIWDVLNDNLDRGRGAVVAPKASKPVAPKASEPVAPKASKPVVPGPVPPKAVWARPHVPHANVGTKPLPFIPVTEHYIKHGEWYEHPATVGYKGEFPEIVTPASEENLGAPLNSQQPQRPECPLAEPASPSADQHLQDLEALTGLSIEDSKLLRGTIYEAINRMATNVNQQIESNKMSSSCEIIGAPEPEKIPGLGNSSLLKNLLHTSEVRNLVLGTIKELIPHVTGTSGDSALGKLTDNIINRSLNVVLGDEDFSEDSEEPSLGSVNENVGSVPDQIGTIIRSLIDQPGIGLENAQLPGIQNIIVNTLGEMLRRGKNVVDNSIIWDALNDSLNQGRGRVVAPKASRPVAARPIPKPALPRPRDHDTIVRTKSLPFIPVTEHYMRNGEWYEHPATVGYKGELPGMAIPAPEENVGAPQGYVAPGASEESECSSEERNTPIQYHSPKDIVLEYIKNHPAGEANRNTHYAETGGDEENFIADRLDSHDQSSDFTASGEEEPRNTVGSSLVNPTYFGKITAPNTGSLRDLENSDLVYIGDGVKLPLTIKRMADGSLALMLSDKICKNFVQKNCPCCLPKPDGEVRYSRRAEEKVTSREIRSTTINGNEATEKPMSGEDASGVTVMPVDKFVEKYNLTLNLENSPNINPWKEKAAEPEESVPPILSYLTDGREQENSEDSYESEEDATMILDSSEKYRYFQDLVSIHDAPKIDHAAMVINAIDDLLKPSAEERLSEREKSADGFEYQKDNPIMERIKSVGEKQSQHGRYKYQQHIDQATKGRMDAVKNVLQWLKNVIVKSEISGSK